MRVDVGGLELGVGGHDLAQPPLVSTLTAHAIVINTVRRRGGEPFTALPVMNEQNSATSFW